MRKIINNLVSFLMILCVVAIGFLSLVLVGTIIIMLIMEISQNITMIFG